MDLACIGNCEIRRVKPSAQLPESLGSQFLGTTTTPKAISSMGVGRLCEAAAAGLQEDPATHSVGIQ